MWISCTGLPRRLRPLSGRRTWATGSRLAPVWRSPHGATSSWNTASSYTTMRMRSKLSARQCTQGERKPGDMEDSQETSGQRLTSDKPMSISQRLTNYQRNSSGTREQSHFISIGSYADGSEYWLEWKCRPPCQLCRFIVAAVQFGQWVGSLPGSGTASLILQSAMRTGWTSEKPTSTPERHSYQPGPNGCLT